MSVAWSRGFDAAANGGEREDFRFLLPLEESNDYEDGFQKGMTAWSLLDAWEQWKTRDGRRERNKNL